MENKEQQEGSTTELPKDTLIFVKSKSVGEDSKGRTKLDLRFSEDETKQLLSEMAKIKERVKLQIHYSEETAFVFVKEVQERGVAFVKKAAPAVKGAVSPTTAAKVAALKKA